MRERVLVVDDDASLRTLLELGLTRYGYDVSVEPDGVAALANFDAHAPDLAIVDVMMPQLDGWQLVRRIREVSRIPILILTAKASDVDKARGLDLGADDYLTKPFSLVELEARVRALLRRYDTPVERGGRPYVAGPLTVDPARHCVSMLDEPVSVTPTEFRILCVLAQSVNRVVTAEHLLHQVWGSDFVDQRAYLKPYISRLRKKLNLPESGPGSIETTYGVGYMMTA